MGIDALGSGGNYNESGEMQVNATDHLETFSQDYALAQANLDIITPTTGKKIEVHSVYLDSGTNVGNTILDFATSSKLIFKGRHSAQQNSKSGEMHIDGGTDELIRLNCPADTTIIVVYHEHS